MRRAAVLLAAGLTFSVAACGGDDTADRSTPSSPSSATSESATDTASPSETGSPSAEAGGFAAQSADDIRAAAVDAMTNLHSVHMQGSVAQQGEQISFDLSLSDNGDCTGTLGLGGGTGKLLSVGGNSYIRADTKFFVAGGAAPSQAKTLLKALKGRYLLLAGQSDQFDSLCDLDTLLADFGGDTAGALSKGEVLEVAGQKAVQVSSKEDLGYIATEGEHYLLRIESTDKSSPGRLDFTEFDEDFVVTKPPARQVFDPTKATG